MKKVAPAPVQEEEKINVAAMHLIDLIDLSADLFEQHNKARKKEEKKVLKVKYNEAAKEVNKRRGGRILIIIS
jgi:DNA integrity scanning protein DisA with diadenylate cyclase activity